MDTQIIRYKTKLRKCPVCGCKVIGSYAYGLLCPDGKMMKDIDDGKIILGGCEVSNNSPNWQCTGCETDFYSVNPRKYF